MTSASKTIANYIFRKNRVETLTPAQAQRVRAAVSEAERISSEPASEQVAVRHPLGGYQVVVREVRSARR